MSYHGEGIATVSKASDPIYRETFEIGFDSKNPREFTIGVRGDEMLFMTIRDEGRVGAGQSIVCVMSPSEASRVAATLQDMVIKKTLL